MKYYGDIDDNSDLATKEYVDANGGKITDVKVNDTSVVTDKIANIDISGKADKSSLGGCTFSSDDNGAYITYTRSGETVTKKLGSSDGTATTDQVLVGATFNSASSDDEQTGTMPNNGSLSNTITTQGGTYTIPSGYTSGGTITAQVGTNKSAATYVPGRYTQTIPAGQYLTGDQTISGDSNLVSSNIASGVSIFGVTGTHTSGTDTSDATVSSSSQILSGYSAYSQGTKYNGSMTNNGSLGTSYLDPGGSYSIPSGYTSGGTVYANSNTETYTVTSTSKEDMGRYNTYRYVQTSGLVKPSGTLPITSNSVYDVSNYKYASVVVPQTISGTSYTQLLCSDGKDGDSQGTSHVTTRHWDMILVISAAGNDGSATSSIKTSASSAVSRSDVSFSNASLSYGVYLNVPVNTEFIGYGGYSRIVDVYGINFSLS